MTVRTFNLLAAAGAALVGATPVGAWLENNREHMPGRKRYAMPYRKYHARNRGSIAQVNRHTGKPHENKREIARRLRQQAVAA